MRGKCSPNNYPKSCPILGTGSTYKYACQCCPLVIKQREKARAIMRDAMTDEEKRKADRPIHERLQEASEQWDRDHEEKLL